MSNIKHLILEMLQKHNKSYEDIVFCSITGEFKNRIGFDKFQVTKSALNNVFEVIQFLDSVTDISLLIAGTILFNDNTQAEYNGTDSWNYVTSPIKEEKYLKLMMKRDNKWNN